MNDLTIFTQPANLYKFNYDVAPDPTRLDSLVGPFRYFSIDFIFYGDSSTAISFSGVPTVTTTDCTLSFNYFTPGADSLRMLTLEFLKTGPNPAANVYVDIQAIIAAVPGVEIVTIPNYR